MRREIARAARRLTGVAVALLWLSVAQAAEPIKIGMGIALTGGLAGTGKAALLATEMWADDVNAAGGLLGRPVQVVYYDDQSNPTLVPGVYTKLLDIDKVDFVVSGYATNMIAPAMPVIIQHGMMFLGLFGLSVNSQFNYDRYFNIVPSGDTPATEFSKGFLDIAMTMQPKPKTIGLVGADAEYAKIAIEGARKNATKLGLKIVYDRSYPPNTVDFAPIIRAIQATNPEVVYVASYPPDSAGIVRAANELGLKTRMFGGGMIGLQYATFKQQFGPLLNGIVDYDVYVPEPTMNFPGIKAFLGKYQTRAVSDGSDPLGFYTPPFAYARMQVLAQAITATGSLDQKILATHIHQTSFPTIIGEVKFGDSGEQSEARVLFVQYRGIKGNDLAQFKEPGRQVILYPPAFKSGDFSYPYAEAVH